MDATCIGAIAGMGLFLLLAAGLVITSEMEHYRSRGKPDPGIERLQCAMDMAEAVAKKHKGCEIHISGRM